jgi:CheY-like chemotaxis protein
VQSAPGEGSTFTLYLPLQYQPLGQPGGEVRVYPIAEPKEAPQEKEQPEAKAETPDAEPADPSPAAPEVAPGQPADKAEPQRELAGKQVLVVDDDIRNVFALTSALEARGLRVMHAESGKEAIDVLKGGEEVDVVLMDVMMPGLDGLDTMRIIRQLEGYASLPIIAVTAKAMIGDREKCIEAGADDYVAKPVNIDVLMGALERLLVPENRPVHG